MKNPYKILQVSSKSSFKDIKQAYLRLVKIHHPDLGGNPKEFIEIKRAFEQLENHKNDNKRGFKRPETEQKSSFDQEWFRRHEIYKRTGKGENKPIYGEHWEIVLGIFIVSTTFFWISGKMAVYRSRQFESKLQTKILKSSNPSTQD